MRTPTSTYRLQITAEFDLVEAARRLPYLRDLGVDWVYLSPLLEAESGSSHGYDVRVHDRIDPSRGGEQGLAALSAEARRLGMGVLVDIVPNHVGIAAPDPGTWWWDLLTHGRDSAYADAFDVDWEVAHDRVVVPVVGDDDLGDDGRIEHLRVVDTGDGLEQRYHDHRFPIAPGTVAAGEQAEQLDANAVHDRQHYRLSSWRVADQGLNYRRFFAVNTLAAIRVEDRRVFDDSHVEIRRWFDEELVDGLRVDHPDGLRDPEGYLADLAELTGDAYVLVEKILEPGEELPTSWPTTGTTGYDALAHLDRALTDPAGQEKLDRLEARLRGRVVEWPQLIHDTKRAVADGILNSEVRRITREVLATGVTIGGPGPVADAVAELLACFGVYRSYLPAGREHLDEAVALARTHRPDLADTLDLLHPLLADPDQPAALRFQQTSGMVMAKGVEDCAFYRHSRLTSLNEVGGDPSIFAITPDEFHDRMAARQRDWPHAMTTLSTHDTKRGEDVRARITVLSELPDEWAATLDELLWKDPVDPGFASLMWQAVVGCWPAERERLHGYVEKAMREAGEQTTWTAPDASYEAQVHRAVDAAYDDERVRALVEGLAARLAGPGWSNALAAKLVALTMPGVPDVYQGSELWEQSLVDPDNRRPVDFDLRAGLLAGELAPRITDRIDDPGHAKLLVTRAALTLRRDRPELFTGYRAVHASGPAADHLLGFDRGGAITLATRLPVGLGERGGWGDTSVDLPDGTWRDVLTGRTAAGTARLADLLADLPVALLAPREES
ncbi:malto-oligosyltrehalose synthase [Nocardioides sp.]|uniref:malto-oligosyltrehalose synthase n=1 Tax=Nocardioides sp. TaxID=35761 RepID=UPI003568B9DD